MMTIILFIMGIEMTTGIATRIGVVSMVSIFYEDWFMIVIILTMMMKIVRVKLL